MRRILIALAALLASSIALGASETINVAAPTQNTDGTTIPASGAGSLVSFRVEYGSCTGASPVLFGTKIGQIIVTMPASSGVVSGLNAATQYCFRAAWTNTVGSESVMSTVVGATTPAAAPVVPNPGTINSVTPTVQTADTNAYKLRQVLGDYSFVAYGTVPAGTPCNPAHSNDGYSVIDRTTVALFSKFDVQPLIAYAHCG